MLIRFINNDYSIVTPVAGTEECELNGDLLVVRAKACCLVGSNSWLDDEVFSSLHIKAFLARILLYMEMWDTVSVAAEAAATAAVANEPTMYMKLGRAFRTSATFVCYQRFLI